MENWSDLFRAFIAPAGKLDLKKLKLGVDFELEAKEGQGLNEGDQTYQAMKEAARQLGLDFEGEK